IVTILSLKHVTHYLYAQPVALGEHRIMVRPLESYDQKLLESALTITPTPSEVRWLQDVFGNAVAIARFGKRSRELRIESRVRMEHSPIRHDDIQIEGYARPGSLHRARAPRSRARGRRLGPAVHSPKANDRDAPDAHGDDDNDPPGVHL